MSYRGASTQMHDFWFGFVVGFIAAVGIFYWVFI